MKIGHQFGLGLVLFVTVNCFWYIKYSETKNQYKYQLNEKEEWVKKQERLIAHQKFFIEKYKEQNILHVTVTAYTPRKSETDATPEYTAIMSKSRPGYTAAVSRDLIHYLGRRIYVEGVGVFGLEDLMNRRYKNRIDLMFGSAKLAREFGKKKMKVIILNPFDDIFDLQAEDAPEYNLANRNT